MTFEDLGLVANWDDEYTLMAYARTAYGTLMDFSKVMNDLKAEFDELPVVPDLRKADLGIPELVFVDKDNKRKGGFNNDKLRKMVNDRLVTLLRSDLSKVIYEHLDKDIEIIFGNSIHEIAQTQDGVAVTFNNGSTRSFDLVIGADGLHSNVRTLIFGDEAQFEKYYGYYTSSYTFENGVFNDRSVRMYNIINRPPKQVRHLAEKYLYEADAFTVCP